MSDNNNTGAFLTGFLIGGLFGAAAALLMAPQPGDQTRVQLKERGIELKTQFDDLTADAREQAEKLATQMQEQGKAMVEEGVSVPSSDDREPTEATADEESG